MLHVNKVRLCDCAHAPVLKEPKQHLFETDEGFQIFTFVCPLRPFLRLPLSPRCALLFITIAVLLCYVPIALVFSIYDSTEVAIQKMIEASQRMITIGSSTEAIEEAPSIGMTPATKRHLELQIKTLRNAPRDPDKLESLLKLKRRQKEKTMERKDTERLVTEIEMLKVVLFLVCRNIKGREE
jgi:hypothetical protein